MDKITQFIKAVKNTSWGQYLYHRRSLGYTEIVVEFFYTVGSFDLASDARVRPSDTNLLKQRIGIIATRYLGKKFKFITYKNKTCVVVFAR